MKRDKQVKTMFSKSEMARLESIRVEYDYPNNAEAIRRSVNDEALVMRLSKHPSMLEPFKLLAGSDVKNLTPLEHVLFSNVDDAENKIDNLKDMFESVDTLQQLIYRNISNVSNNLNQIAKAINTSAKSGELDEDLVADALDFISGMDGDFKQLHGEFDELRKVVKRGGGAN